MKKIKGGKKQQVLIREKTSLGPSDTWKKIPLTLLRHLVAGLLSANSLHSRRQFNMN